MNAIIDIFWNAKKKTIRGSSVNLVITLTILFLVVCGAFNAKIADNVSKMSALIGGFFLSSMGIWSVKKYKEGANGHDESN